MELLNGEELNEVSAALGWLRRRPEVDGEAHRRGRPFFRGLNRPRAGGQAPGYSRWSDLRRGCRQLGELPGPAQAAADRGGANACAAAVRLRGQRLLNCASQGLECRDAAPREGAQVENIIRRLVKIRGPDTISCFGRCPRGKPTCSPFWTRICDANCRARLYRMGPTPGSRASGGCFAISHHMKRSHFISGVEASESSKCLKALCLAAILTLSGCASLGPLGRVILPLRFSEVPGERSTIRLVGPNARQPLGGAALRLWTRVHNPNPVGLTLSTLRAEVSLTALARPPATFPWASAPGSRRVRHPTRPVNRFCRSAGPGRCASPDRVESGRGLPAGWEFQYRGWRPGPPPFGPMRLFEGRLGR